MVSTAGINNGPSPPGRLSAPVCPFGGHVGQTDEAPGPLDILVAEIRGR